MNFQLKQGTGVRYNKFISSRKNTMNTNECVQEAGTSRPLNTDPGA
jgi:hypothetical protein